MERRLYTDLEYWKKYLPFLPEEMRFTDDVQPEEEWWQWRGNDIHVDRLRSPKSKCKFIFLHGGGGNGRLMGTIAACFYKLGYEYLAPDLPGFGLTLADKASRTNYAAWVDLASDLVDREYREDGRPVIVFGGSIGGMLAYHVGCRNENVRGIIATCLVDSRTAAGRDALARNKLWSRAGYVTTTLFPFIIRIINIRVHTISKLMAMTNDPDFSRLFVDDPLVGRARMNLGFYKSMTAYTPAVEPELFTRCPLLLVHPELDRWTPFELSKSFFDRLAGEKTCVLLEGAGHYPYEKPGLDQMIEAVTKFANDIVS